MPLEPTKHSRRYSPSKSATWINCALSTLYSDLGSNEANPAAEFGSQTHELGAALICKSLKIEDFDSEPKSIDEIKKELNLYDDNMQKLADGYADFVLSQVEYERKRTGNAPFTVVETHLDMDFDEDAGGTLDFGMITQGEDPTLVVIDLKTGRLPVKAFNEETGTFNYQLGLYALYLYKTYQDIYPVKKVRLVIYQPVINNTNEYEMDLQELLDFEENTLIPAVLRTKVDHLESKAGPYCRYCPGRETCRTRAEASLVEEKELKKPDLLTDAEIEELLPKLDAIISFAEDLKEYALKRALKGHKWSGFKLVHGRTTRKFTNEEEVIKICEENNVDPYSPRKLAGINDISKKLGKAKFNELILPFVEKQEGSLQLVADSKPGEEVEINKGEINNA